MITEDYVSFETAKLLKEKGFQAKCTACYRSDPSHTFELVSGRINYCSPRFNKYKMIPPYNAPTLQMALKWLREVHNVFIDISSRFSKNADKDICFSYSCKKLIDTYKSSYEIGDGEWLNYEEACEVAIKDCLENLI